MAAVDATQAALAGIGTAGDKLARVSERETKLPLPAALLEDTGRLIAPLRAPRPSREGYADDVSWRDAVRDWWARRKQALNSVWGQVRPLREVLVDCDIAHPGSTLCLRFENDLGSILPEYGTEELDEHTALMFLVAARGLLAEGLAQAAGPAAQPTASAQVAPRPAGQVQPVNGRMFWDKPFYMVAEIAERLSVSYETARKRVHLELGIMDVRTPGAKKAAIRVPAEVAERIYQRVLKQQGPSLHVLVPDDARASQTLDSVKPSIRLIPKT